MKRILVLIVLFFLPLIGHSDVMLNAGDSFQFDFTFDDFNYQFDMPPPAEEPAPIQFAYTLTKVSSLVSLRLSLFRDNSPTPFMVVTNSHFSVITIPPVDTEPFPVMLDPDPNNFWPTGIGTMKLEALDASVRIDSMVAATVINDKYYQAPAAIPEPSSIALILLGGGCIYLRKKRTHNQSLELTRDNAQF